MPNAIRFHKSGGPEVLVWEPVPIGKPGPGDPGVLAEIERRDGTRDGQIKTRCS